MLLLSVVLGVKILGTVDVTVRGITKHACNTRFLLLTCVLSCRSHHAEHRIECRSTRRAARDNVRDRRVATAHNTVNVMTPSTVVPVVSRDSTENAVRPEDHLSTLAQDLEVNITAQAAQQDLVQVAQAQGTEAEQAAHPNASEGEVLSTCTCTDTSKLT